MATQGKKRPVIYSFLALGVWVICCALAAAEELLRFSHNVPGDSKPIILHADEMTTWMEGGRRIILLKGKVLAEHGVVQVRAQQAVAWVDQERQRQTGIMHVEVYAEGDVTLENGPQTQAAPRAVVDLFTRGEVKLKSHNGKVIQKPQPDDPLYRRARDIQSSQDKKGSAGPVQQASFREVPPTQPAGSPYHEVLPVQGPTGPPASGPPQPTLQPPAPNSPTAPLVPPPVINPTVPVPAPQPALPPAPTVPGIRPSAIPFPRAGPPGTGQGSQGPLRQFSIEPRSPGGFEYQSVPPANGDPNGEHTVVVSGGVILIVRSSDNSQLLDIEADRLVFWTRRNPKDVLGNLRTPEGQTSRELEFYLAGNVEIRSRSGKENRLLRADEVYYDVSRNVAVALHADLEFRQPGLPDPVHLRAEELDQLSRDLFKGLKAEVFSSKLSSDPGLKVYVSEATVENKEVPKRSLFGPVLNRQTGQPETEPQRLINSRNVFLEVEDVPVFYLPFLQGDAHEPLGPLQSASLSYNRIYGAQVSATLDVFNLLGIDPPPGTRWRLDADYLSRRGPALGTNYESFSKTFLGLPAATNEEVKAYGIDDTASDLQGGTRTQFQHHPELRGRFLWRENVQALPEGFSLQTQLSALSDKNFLEEYDKAEFDQDINQETFVYLKQQKDNWAWTVLTEPRLRDWVTETEWLPRADGYLIGQSFFDRLTYNVHGSAGYGSLKITHLPPPPVEATDQNTDTARFDLNQELSAPFSLGPLRLVPYVRSDLTYYTADLTDNDRGRFYIGGGVRGSIPFTRLYPDIQSELFNLNGINHKIVISGNYYVAHSDTSFRRLPQLDLLTDDASDQALRDIKPLEPLFNPAHGLALATSPVFDPQLYAIRRLVDDRVDTLDSIEVVEGDIRQRWQTKRGYPGQQHIVDWMTLDLSASFFPNSRRDNFGENFAFLQYDWTWNIGDRTALVSSGWLDPEDNGPRVFTIGAYLNRPDRTSFFVGYRQINLLNSQAITGAVTYVFSPKYAMSASATFDIGNNIQANSLVLTRIGSDLQMSLGINYNSIVNTFGVTFEIVPNIVPPNKRIPGLAALGPALLQR